MNRDHLLSLTLTRLKEIARELLIPRYSTFRKETKHLLVEEILKIQSGEILPKVKSPKPRLSHFDYLPPEIFGLVEKHLMFSDKINFLIAFPEYETLLHINAPIETTIKEFRQYRHGLGPERFHRIFQFKLMLYRNIVQSELTIAILMPKGAFLLTNDPNRNISLTNADVDTLLDMRLQNDFYYLKEKGQDGKISPIFVSFGQMSDWYNIHGKEFHNRILFSRKLRLGVL